jgi:hypothetical protein
MPPVNIVHPDETNVTQEYIADINAGIRANHEFATRRANNQNYGTIIEWDIYNEKGIPTYNMSLHELGLSRDAFEDICNRLRSTYNSGRNDIHWPATIFFGTLLLPFVLCLIPCGLFPCRDEHKVAQPMGVAIGKINRQLQANMIPIAFSFKVHMQLRPVLHEVTIQHVPLR